MYCRNKVNYYYYYLFIVILDIMKKTFKMFADCFKLVVVVVVNNFPLKVMFLCSLFAFIKFPLYISVQDSLSAMSLCLYLQ